MIMVGSCGDGSLTRPCSQSPQGVWFESVLKSGTSNPAIHSGTTLRSEIKSNRSFPGLIMYLGIS